MLDYMLITNNAEFARFAVASGVQRIFVDLELIGKKERQGHLNTFISDHTMKDVNKIKTITNGMAELLVRLNPYNPATEDEVDGAIAGGADILMLPMFTTIEEVKEFCRCVNGRVKIIPLVETYKALKIAVEVAKVPGVSEVFIGLNDLHLDMRLDFMFEIMLNAIFEQHTKAIAALGIKFGFGGIARISEGLLPAELILAEHIRLKSSSVILSRTFNRYDDELSQGENFKSFATEFAKLKACEAELLQKSSQFFDENRIVLTRKIKSIVEIIRKKRDSINEADF